MNACTNPDCAYYWLYLIRDLISPVPRTLIMSASDLLPHRLPSLKGFKAERVLNDGKDNGGVVALLGNFEGNAHQAVVKLSRPPIPLGDLDGLATSVSLSERMPYSGMEYGYYHGTAGRVPGTCRLHNTQLIPNSEDISNLA